MFNKELIGTTKKLVELCADQGWEITTAESCTGGLIAACLTEVPGTSEVFGRGVVTYANEEKQALLGVPAEMLAAHGAVSCEVATAMAEGALGQSKAHLAVAVTGIAGPAGGSAAKPVGLVFLAASHRKTPGDRPETLVEEHHFSGDRQAVRLAAVGAALALLLRLATAKADA